jgi:glycosyltransferase involved in cell wall biosynthesis
LGDIPYITTECHYIKVLTLFIHGSLSKTLEHEKGISRNQIIRTSEIEKRQREHVDFYFTLDNWYPKQLGLNLSKCRQINPWLFIKKPRYIDLTSPTNQSISFVFFGRWERRKGVDKIPNYIKLMPQENIKMKIGVY